MLHGAGDEYLPQRSAAPLVARAVLVEEHEVDLLVLVVYEMVLHEHTAQMQGRDTLLVEELLSAPSRRPQQLSDN